MLAIRPSTSELYFLIFDFIISSPLCTAVADYCQHLVWPSCVPLLMHHHDHGHFGVFVDDRIINRCHAFIVCNDAAVKWQQSERNRWPVVDCGQCKCRILDEVQQAQVVNITSPVTLTPSLSIWSRRWECTKRICWMVSTCPLMAAQCNGVLPLWSLWWFKWTITIAPGHSLWIDTLWISE